MTVEKVWPRPAFSLQRIGIIDAEAFEIAQAVLENRS